MKTMTKTVKYRVAARRYDDIAIYRMEVDRETETSIWVDGIRQSKVSAWSRIYDTWQEAYDYLHDRVVRRQNALADQISDINVLRKALESTRKDSTLPYKGRHS